MPTVGFTSVVAHDVATTTADAQVAFYLTNTRRAIPSHYETALRMALERLFGVKT